MMNLEGVDDKNGKVLFRNDAEGIEFSIVSPGKQFSCNAVLQKELNDYKICEIQGYFKFGVPLKPIAQIMKSLRNCFQKFLTIEYRSFDPML